jgi:ribonuclease BN (tRNA processing enzyme)
MLNGYLRKENEKILIYPRVSEEESIDSLKRVYTLIDFNSKVGDTWNISYSTDGYYCRKLKLLDIKYDSLLNDSTFLISMQNISPRSFPSPSHTEEAKMMIIGRTRGFIVFGVQSYMNIGWYFLKRGKQNKPT